MLTNECRTRARKSTSLIAEVSRDEPIAALLGSRARSLSVRGIDIPPKIGSTQYFTAYGAATGGYPLLRGDRPGPGETDPPEVLDLMHRVTLIPSVRRTLFGPRITVFLKNGRSFTKEGTGREFIWDFEEEARRISPIAPGTAIGDPRFAELIDTCRYLDRLDRAADKLIALTIPA